MTLPPAVSKYFPAVPNPTADPDSILAAVQALKGGYEVLVRQQDPKMYSAVLWQELVDAGIIASDGGSLDASQGTLSGLRRLLGANNSGVPTSKMDFSFSECVLRDATGATRFQINKSFTVDLTVTGANGRDQTAVFPASNFIHFYTIDGAAVPVAGIASLADPTAATGPSLPAGYTHWAYVFSARWNASSQLVPIFVRGNRVFYSTFQDALFRGDKQVETAASVASFVPSCASEYFLNNHISMDVNGFVAADLVLRFSTGADHFRQQIVGSTAGSAAGGSTTPMPNVNQNFYYLFQDAAGTFAANLRALNATIRVQSYIVPNGGA